MRKAIYQVHEKCKEEERIEKQLLQNKEKEKAEEERKRKERLENMNKRKEWDEGY